ncbi:hypothetical protein [Alkalicoccobacillus plakortidis]|uniref:Uncharacterized protein n=1 Tax=Alkalicoccobacillus plakortidis TaxID=444060 RepID=A0ABT0XI73_9BACI|nr:hypothetical protein [Alkalicoccobacillus plakortidis]MCM2675603.1 hypothetical protein [Alkalicoccobacillus plakortidis]
MKAAEATKMAQQGKVNLVSKVVKEIESRIVEECEDGKPSLNIFTLGFEIKAVLQEVMAHFEGNEYDVAVDGDYLTIYWGYDDSEIEGQ